MVVKSQNLIWSISLHFSIWCEEKQYSQCHLHIEDNVGGYGTAQDYTGQYCQAQYCKVQYIASHVLYSKAQYCTLKHSTVPHSTVHTRSTVLYSAVQ